MATRNSTKKPPSNTAKKTVPFTDADLDRLRKGACCVDVLSKLAAGDPGNDPGPLEAAIEIAKEKLWPFYYELSERFDNPAESAQKSDSIGLDAEDAQIHSLRIVESLRGLLSIVSDADEFHPEDSYILYLAACKLEDEMKVWAGVEE